MSNKCVFLSENIKVGRKTCQKMESISKRELSRKIKFVIKGQSFTDNNWKYDSGDIVEQGRPNRIPHGGSECVVGEVQEG